MGHSEVVQLLLEDGRVRSSATQQDNHGWSVLHLAVHNRDLATINVLMDSSLITEPRAFFDESGLTAEEWLDLGPTSHPYKATSNLAFSKSRCCRATTMLRYAVVIGNIPMIKLFIRSEYYKVNDMDSGRRTALYYASKKRMLPIMDLLLSIGADPNILPTGRKTWEEFISDKDVLQRLHQAGYQRQDTDPELERQIRRALRPKGQFSIPDRTVSFAPEESVTPMSWRPTFPTEPEQSSSSVPASSTPSVPDHSASSTPMESPAPTPQTNDNKRKSRTVRSRATGFWKRLIG
jgi:ankyrin repeat protein